MIVGYLAAAYGVVWLALFGYLFLLTRKTNQVEREIEALKDEIERIRRAVAPNDAEGTDSPS